MCPTIIVYWNMRLTLTMHLNWQSAQLYLWEKNVWNTFIHYYLIWQMVIQKGTFLHRWLGNKFLLPPWLERKDKVKFANTYLHFRQDKNCLTAKIVKKMYRRVGSFGFTNGVELIITKRVDLNNFNFMVMSGYAMYKKLLWSHQSVLWCSNF